MPEESQTPDPPEKREKGPSTLIAEAQALVGLAQGERERRQDERADKLLEATLESARFTKRVLAFLLVVSLTGNAVLTAMVLGSELEVTKEGVKVTADGGE